MTFFSTARRFEVVCEQKILLEIGVIYIQHLVFEIRSGFCFVA